MKKQIRKSKVYLMALALIMVFASISNANSRPVGLYMEDQKLNSPVPPVLEDGRTLVPMRYIFEQVGAEVDWNQKTQTATAYKDGTKIDLPIGKSFAYLDGKKVNLDVGPKVVRGSTLVPIRFIGETLGFKTGWDNNTKSVLLDSKAPYGNYKVTRVVDGDTLKVMFNGKEESLRLIGVDTPESVHPDKSKNTKEGKIASDFAKKRLAGKSIAIEFDVQERDKYGRLLGYVYHNGEMFNQVLLEKGYARLATFPPNTKYVDDFVKLEKKAIRDKAGFWKNGFKTNPQIVSPKPKPKPKPSAPSVPKDGAYIGSINSDKYHKKGCRWEKKIKYANRIGFKDKADARKQGYKPCGTCKP